MEEVKVESKECVGKCPKCNSGNVKYEKIVDTGDDVYYPLKCQDCGAEAREYYFVEYSETVAL